MAIQPKPFKIYCPKCGFEKMIQFKSDCLGAGDFKQIPQICPKCGNDKFERKPYTDTGYSMFDLIKKIFK